MRHDELHVGDIDREQPEQGRLEAAEFDEHAGAIQHVGELRDCMARSICYVDAATSEG